MCADRVMFVCHTICKLRDGVIFLAGKFLNIVFWFFLQELANASDVEKDREAEKAARVEASLREREKEVQRTLAVHLRDRDNEREQHKHDEAVHHFNALLADLVRVGWGLFFYVFNLW